MLGKKAEDAARLYTRTFPDCHLGQIQRAPSETPSGPAGGAKAGRAFDAMMQMRKIDDAMIDVARRTGRARLSNPYPRPI